MRKLDLMLRDQALLGVALVSTLALIGASTWLVIDLLVTAWPRLGWHLLWQAPARAGRAGGLSSILVATGAIVAIGLLLAAPLGIAAAVALSEARSRWADVVRTSLDLLAGAPSIVLGLVGLLLFGDLLGLGYSLATGGLTLALMVLPLVIRFAEVGIRSAPAEQRAAAAALALSRWTTLRRIVLPAALPSLAAAITLSIGRALAETAALVFTAGGSDRMPTSWADPGRTLAVHIYDVALNVAGGDASAAAAAVVLLAILLVVQVALIVCLRCGRSR